MIVIFYAVFSFFLGGGRGGRMAEPDQQAYFDQYPPISTHIFQVLPFNFHIN